MSTVGLIQSNLPATLTLHCCIYFNVQSTMQTNMAESVLSFVEKYKFLY